MRGLRQPASVESPVNAAIGSRTPLLDVQELWVRYLNGAGGELPALRGLSLSLEQGEVLGIVGETGSGKSTLAHTLLGLVPAGSVQGDIYLAGEPLRVQSEEAMRGVRWRRIALVFQSAGTGFNPVQRIGDQVGEPLVAHLGCSPAEARAHVSRLWEEVGLPAERIHHYPHQLSGGEKRLAMLAMALVCQPELLLLDEPTAGMDSFTRGAILSLLMKLRRTHGLSMIVISHTLADLPGLADRTMVLYAGRAVEAGPTEDVLADPRHPYSWGLVNAYPTMKRAKELWGIRGDPPDPMELPPGCAFAPRCTQKVEVCQRTAPCLETPGDRKVACHLGGLQTLLEVCGLSRSFPDGRGRPLPVVRGVNLRVREGEVVALVGRTGSGKSTLARLMVGLLKPEGGDVMLRGHSLARLRGAELRAARSSLQLISQDPFDALSPRLSVLEMVREPLDIQGKGTRAERESGSRTALCQVRLPITPNFLARRAHELSGGQLQRIAIARALVLRPKLIIADEPVSMLDASEQARLLRLLKEIQNEQGMGLLLISHDVALVRKVADRIVVLERGEVVEEGPAERVINTPGHPCTRRLLLAAGAALGVRDSPDGEPGISPRYSVRGG